MKQVITKQMIEQTTTKYIADDGKEFDTERDCQNYETRKNIDKVNVEFRKLNPIKVPAPFLRSYDSEQDVVFVTLKDESDFVLVANYLVANYPYCWSWSELANKHFTYPTKLFIQSCCDNAWYYTPEDKLISELKKLAEMIPQFEKENANESN